MGKRHQGAELGLRSIETIDLEKGAQYLRNSSVAGRTFERRFIGKNNAGLRAKIRAAVAVHRCGQANAQAVRALGRTVALTAFGRTTLEQVAADYKGANNASKTTCDCDSCYAGNMQLLGRSVR